MLSDVHCVHRCSAPIPETTHRRIVLCYAAFSRDDWGVLSHATDTLLSTLYFDCLVPSTVIAVDTWPKVGRLLSASLSGLHCHKGKGAPSRVLTSPALDIQPCSPLPSPPSLLVSRYLERITHALPSRQESGKPHRNVVYVYINIYIYKRINIETREDVRGNRKREVVMYKGIA